MRAEQAKPDNGRCEMREPKKPVIEIKITIPDMAKLFQQLQELRDIIANYDPNKK